MRADQTIPAAVKRWVGNRTKASCELLEVGEVFVVSHEATEFSTSFCAFMSATGTSDMAAFETGPNDTE